VLVSYLIASSSKIMQMLLEQGSIILALVLRSDTLPCGLYILHSGLFFRCEDGYFIGEEEQGLETEKS
jgi:hypothetical protein